MAGKYIRRFKRLMKNRYVHKWVLTLFALICVICASFMFYIYSYAQRSLEQEYTAYSQIQTDRITAYLDEEFTNCQYVAILLSKNEYVQFYMLDKDAERVFPDLSEKILGHISAYRWSNQAIDSVYLYAKTWETVIRSDTDYITTTESLRLVDKNYLACTEGIGEYALVFREKNDIYPYLCSICYPVSSGSAEGLVTVNVNLSRISVLSDQAQESYQEIYIVSEAGEILYRKGQQAMPEALDTVPQLVYFENNGEDISKYIEDSAPYIYVQQHSEKFPWYYITVTYPQNFSSTPFNFFASAKRILPWMIVLAAIVFIWLFVLAIRPIRSIADFLEDPMSMTPEDMGEPETEEMVRRFIQYIESNQALSKELKHQMELQNKATLVALQTQINPHFLFNTLNLIRNIEIEALGFEHEAPKLTLSLTKLLRYALDSDEMVPLANELDYAKLYLEILRQRYGKKLTFTISQDPLADAVRIPKLIIQPLIENAVFHGCAPQLDKDNRVDIITRTDEGRCFVTVADNGTGMTNGQLTQLLQKIEDAKSIPSDSIGLQNVILRMHLIFGERFQYQIESVPGEGTRMVLSFPEQL